ncbi:MAG: signal peptidase I [Pseudomonadota bacterium]
MRIAGTLVGVAALVAGWLFLAPPQLGGSTGYVVLYGTSMEPGYGAGDLVLVRPARHVAVGDVVAYRHPTLGRTVLHRVVARAGDRLQFKGDNNDFLDLPRPTAVDVVGREWVHVPAVGAALEWVRQPLVAAIAAALCALLLLGGGATVTRRRSGRIAPDEAPPRVSADEAQGRRAVEALAVVGSVVLLGLGLGAVAWSRPLDERAPWPGRWEHEARLSYGASVRPTPVYPAGRVVTGETVFARQAPRVRFRVDYRLRAREGAARVAGTAALEARIRGDNGWRRTVPLVPARPLRGDRAVLAGELDLGALVRLAQRVEALTGVRAAAYDVTLAPVVRVGGSVGEDALHDRFAPAFPFRLQDGRLEAVAPQPDPATGVDPSAWTRTQAGTGTRVEAARVALGPASVSVRALRFLSVGLGLLALALIPFGVVYVLVGRRGDGDELAGVEPWIVDVARIPEAREVRDVPSPEALVRLAERYDTVVLRVVRPGGRLLGVEVSGVLYRHVLGVVEDWPTEVRPAPVTHLRERAAR